MLIRYLIIFVFSLFILISGIYLLILAYLFHNPIYFIMTFFSASLVILIGASLSLGMILRIYNQFKEKNN